MGSQLALDQDITKITEMNKTSFGNLYGTSGTSFADNTTGEISEGDMRAFGEGIKTSTMFIDDNFIDEDSFASDSATKAPSQKSTKAYIGTRVNAMAIDAQGAGNTGTGEDLLMGVAVGSGLLANDGDYILMTVSGTFAANNNNKTVKVHFNQSGSPVELFSSGAVAFNDGFWHFSVEIVRTGGTFQKCSVVFHANSTGGTPQDVHKTIFRETTQDPSLATLQIVVTGEGTSNDDVVKEVARVMYGKATSVQI